MNLLISFLIFVATHTKPIRATALIDANTNALQEDWRSQFDQILVQMCTLEIDRNRTSSAMVKLDQMSNAKELVGDVIKFFTRHYVDKFVDLLRFIDQIEATDLQQEASNALNNIIDSNGLELVNVLRFENFVYSRLEIATTDSDKDFYGKIHSNVSHYISKRFNDFAGSIESVSTSYYKKVKDPMYELVPNLARVVDLNSFDAMDKVLAITVLLPYKNQMLFVGKILSRMRSESNYKHIYHILLRISSLRYSTSDSISCFLLEIEKELPSKLKPFFTSNKNYWSIENVATKEFMYPADLQNRTRNVILSPHAHPLWIALSDAYTSGNEFFFFCYINNYRRKCLSVVSTNNASIPVIDEEMDFKNPDRALNQWYLLMSNDLDSFQIKIIDTDQCLNSSEEQVYEDGELQRRVVLTECGLESLSSKWQFKAGDKSYLESPNECIT